MTSRSRPRLGGLALGSSIESFSLIRAPPAISRPISMPCRYNDSSTARRILMPGPRRIDHPSGEGAGGGIHRLRHYRTIGSLHAPSPTPGPTPCSTHPPVVRLVPTPRGVRVMASGSERSEPQDALESTCSTTASPASLARAWEAKSQDCPHGRPRGEALPHHGGEMCSYNRPAWAISGAPTCGMDSAWTARARIFAASEMSRNLDEEDQPPGPGGVRLRLIVEERGP